LGACSGYRPRRTHSRLEEVGEVIPPITITTITIGVGALTGAIAEGCARLAAAVEVCAVVKG
jgi:hypothetical protein